MKKSLILLIVLIYFVFCGFAIGSIQSTGVLEQITRIAYLDSLKKSQPLALNLIEAEIPDSIKKSIIQTALPEFDEFPGQNLWSEYTDKDLDILNSVDFDLCFSYAFYHLEGHDNILIVILGSPLDTYAFIECKDSLGNWNQQPIKIPAAHIYFSKDGYVAGITETNEEYFVRIKFYKVLWPSNDNELKITEIGVFDTLNSIANWLSPCISDNEVGFWLNNNFYFEIRTLEPESQSDSEQSHRQFYKLNITHLLK